MEQWTGQGLVLKTQPHGESGVILHVLTSEHGRYAGYVYGARKRSGELQLGAELTLEWRARVETFLGTFTSTEAMRVLDPAVLDCPARLTALQSVCVLLYEALPERLPCPEIFAATQSLLIILAQADPNIWAPTLIHWEIGLLKELGYGLDLSCCAVTGRRDNLTWVSPKSGRAVSHAAGAQWADKLLILPEFLGPEASRSDTITHKAIREGLNLTASFLERWPLAALNRPLPSCRTDLAAILSRVLEADTLQFQGTHETP